MMLPYLFLSPNRDHFNSKNVDNWQYHIVSYIILFAILLSFNVKLKPLYSISPYYTEVGLSREPWNCILNDMDNIHVSGRFEYPTHFRFTISEGSIWIWKINGISLAVGNILSKKNMHQIHFVPLHLPEKFQKYCLFRPKDIFIGFIVP